MYELKVVRERKQGYGKLRRIRDAREVYEVFKEEFGSLDRELFLAIVLDGKNQVVGFNQVSVGSLTAALVHPREVFTSRRRSSRTRRRSSSSTTIRPGTQSHPPKTARSRNA